MLSTVFHSIVVPAEALLGYYNITTALIDLGIKFYNQGIYSFIFQDYITLVTESYFLIAFAGEIVLTLRRTIVGQTIIVEEVGEEESELINSDIHALHILRKSVNSIKD